MKHHPRAPSVCDGCAPHSQSCNKQHSKQHIQRVSTCVKLLVLTDCYLNLQGKYLGNRKNGDGMYCFVNGDVYEGEFRDDRMAGVGVYTFSPEGR